MNTSYSFLCNFSALLFKTAAIIAFLSGCVSHQASDAKLAIQPNSEYCDSYLSYPMCAKDVDGNGEVDFMYFNDSMEIFMVMADYLGAEFEGLTYHECTQEMDESLQRISSELLYITEDTSSLERSAIQARLMLNYSRYIAKVSSCHDPNYASDEGFGDEDFEEL